MVHKILYQCPVRPFFSALFLHQLLFEFLSEHLWELIHSLMTTEKKLTRAKTHNLKIGHEKAFLLGLHYQLTTPLPSVFKLYSLLPFPCTMRHPPPISLGFKLFVMANIYFIPSKFLYLTSSTKEIFRIQASIYVGPWVELLMLTCLSKGAKGPFSEM